MKVIMFGYAWLFGCAFMLNAWFSMAFIITIVSMVQIISTNPDRYLTWLEKYF